MDLVLWYVYVLIPFIDLVFPLDRENLTERAKKAHEKDWRYMIPLYASIIISIWSECLFLYQLRNGLRVGFVRFFISAVVMSHILGEAGIVGHELIHRKETVHKMFGFIPYL